MKGEFIKELKQISKDVLSRFDVLKSVLSCAEHNDGKLIIFDPPYILEISKKEEILILKVNNEDLVILTPNEVILKGNYEDLIALHRLCTSLISMNFKRYILKNKKQKN